MITPASRAKPAPSATRSAAKAATAAKLAPRVAAVVAKRTAAAQQRQATAPEGAAPGLTPASLRQLGQAQRRQQAKPAPSPLRQQLDAVRELRRRVQAAERPALRAQTEALRDQRLAKTAGQLRLRLRRATGKASN